MQSVDEELQAAREEKAGLHERVTEARRMLTMSKEKLRSRSSVHRVLINERVAFEEKAQKKRLENVRRGHTVQSTRNDVAALQEEFDILEVEMKEAELALGHETAQVLHILLVQTCFHMHLQMQFALPVSFCARASICSYAQRMRNMQHDLRTCLQRDNLVMLIQRAQKEFLIQQVWPSCPNLLLSRCVKLSFYWCAVAGER